MKASRLVTLAAVSALALSAAGCSSGFISGETSKIETAVSNMTVGQQLTLAATLVNGACQLTVAGANFAGGVNAIVHPNATTGGSGASATGTITKVTAIDSLSCAALNGASAQLIALASNGAATVSVSTPVAVVPGAAQ